jgi:hypothetical protein
MNGPELKLWWERRDPAEADDARRLSQFVTGLPNFDPIYRSWLSSPTTKKEVAPVPLSEAEAKRLLIDKMARYDSPNRPWPELGSFVGGGHAGPPPYDFRESSYADSRYHVGSYGPDKSAGANNIFMRLSASRPTIGRPWRASEVRPLMKFAREVWEPMAMCVMFPFQTNLPSVPNPLRPTHQRPLRPRIGWITYLPPDLSSRTNYPAGVEVEALNDGAVLVTLCEEPFEKNDAEGMARLRGLEAALRSIQS